MYGHGHLTIDQSESKLSVRQSVGGVLSDDLWFMTDEQGMMWHQAMVTIDQQVGGQVCSPRSHSSNLRRILIDYSLFCRL